MKLLANENFPHASVLLLRRLGYDIFSIGEGDAGITDESVIEFADKEQRLILTFDRDYGELIYKYKFKPQAGVIYFRLSNYAPDEPARITHQLLDVQKIDTAGMFTVFDGETVRQRKY